MAANKRLKVSQLREASFNSGKIVGVQEGMRIQKQQMEKDHLEAKTELLKAAAEVAQTFAKVMYNINMLVNDKTPFNGS